MNKSDVNWKKQTDLHFKTESETDSFRESGEIYSPGGGIWTAVAQIRMKGDRMIRYKAVLSDARGIEEAQRFVEEKLGKLRGMV